MAKDTGDWPDLKMGEELIVDAHHHLVDGAPPYLLDEFDRDHDGLRLVGSLFVECSFRLSGGGSAERSTLAETAAVARLDSEARARGPRPWLGIIAHAPLRLGESVGRLLDEHIAAAGGRLVSIRNVSAWDPDPALRHLRADPPPALLSMRSFREGFRQLAPRGLAFDAWLYHTQIDELRDLAETFPETTVVLNHMGGPVGVGPYAGRSDEVFSAWRQALRRLAGCPNVYVKIGGLGMRTSGLDIFDRARRADAGELADRWRPFVETCIGIFGAGNCMFESNFPVDAQACDYRTLWATFSRIAADCDPAEQRALFGGTACRAYRLPSDVSKHFTVDTHALDSGTPPHLT